MEIVFYFITVVATFFFMEFMAWFTHKYLMHGMMWYFHKDHHQHEEGFFEKNDVFFLIFAVPSWLCIMLGLMAGNYIVASIALRKAHKIHHKNIGKEHGKVFGMLIVPSKFLKESKIAVANKKAIKKV